MLYSDVGSPIALAPFRRSDRNLRVDLLENCVERKDPEPARDRGVVLIVIEGDEEAPAAGSESLCLHPFVEPVDEQNGLAAGRDEPEPVTEKTSGRLCRLSYILVVEISECPNHSWTLVISALLSKALVAAVERMTCGLRSLK